MILRIYRVKIVQQLRKEFEKQFAAVKDDFITGRKGLISVEIAKPTQHAPDEYMMITRWNNLESVRRFAGEDWTQPVIPDHMQKYTQQCWLHHYESF